MGFNPWLCLFVATTGGWIGGLVIYGVGYAGNATRIRKLFHIKEEQLLKQKNKIKKYGGLMALLVWIPVIGDISNVALGFYKTKRTHTFYPDVYRQNVPLSAMDAIVPDLFKPFLQIFSINS